MVARRLDPASDAMLRRPGRPPLPALLRPLLDRFETRHLELMAEAGFDDVRRAHNAVFVHLPAEGSRLTDLADAADISKQAMGELVDDLVAKDYLERIRDPSDGRAKLIRWAERGQQAHRATLDAFATIDAELSAAFGATRFDDLRDVLLDLVRVVPSGSPQG